MGNVSLLLYCGAGAPDGRVLSGPRLAQSLVDLGLARTAPGEPGLLVRDDPPFRPTLAGRLPARTDGDFTRLKRHADRLRGRVARRASSTRPERILVAPEIAARASQLGPILAGLRAGASQAHIEAALPPRETLDAGPESRLALIRGRRAYLRACTHADLVIGGAGFAALERAAAGLAQILIPDGPGETRLAAELDRTGAAMKLNPGDDIAAAIERVVADLFALPAMIRLMSDAALDLADRLDPDQALAAIAALAGVQVEKPSTISALRGSA